MTNPSLPSLPRIAGLNHRNIALIVFVAIGIVLGTIAAYLFVSSTFRWLVVIALGLGLLAGGAALGRHCLP